MKRFHVFHYVNIFVPLQFKRSFLNLYVGSEHMYAMRSYFCSSFWTPFSVFGYFDLNTGIDQSGIV